MEYYNRSVIILAGGKGSRMGYVDKAFLEYDGKPFIDHILKKVEKFKEIIIISNDIEKFKNYINKNKNIRIVEDLIKDIGPIGGIYTGLKKITFESSLILSCDTPFIAEELITYYGKYQDDFNAVIPRYEFMGHLMKEPLCGLYSKQMIKIIENNIRKNNYKIGVNFKNIEVDWINLNGWSNFDNILSSFFNINTPKDLSEIGGTICA